MNYALLVIDKIKEYYSRIEYITTPIFKFLLAIICISKINSSMGFNEAALNNGVVWMVSLACSFLPAGSIPFFAAIYSLMHMYSVSLEALLLGVVVYIILFVLFFRLDSKFTFLAALTPLLFAAKLEFLLPVSVGLLASPMAAVSVGSGVVAYFLIQTIINNASMFEALADGEIIERFKMITDAFLENQYALSYVWVFAVVILVVYIIKRIPFRFNWTVAMCVGALLNIVLMIIEKNKNEFDLSVGGLIWVSILSVLLGKIIELFEYYVDHRRTEKVQFEDDDYYYYVTAVPKVKADMGKPATQPAKRPAANRQPAPTVRKPVRPAEPKQKDFYEEKINEEPIRRKPAPVNNSSNDDFDDLF